MDVAQEVELLTDQKVGGSIPQQSECHWCVSVCEWILILASSWNLAL